MATIPLALGSALGFPFDRPRLARIERVIDASLIAGGLVTTNVYEVLNIPANARVLNVQVDVTKVNTGSSTRTFNVGDTAGASNWFAAVDAKTLGKRTNVLTLTEAAPNTVTGNSDGKVYASADTIKITPVQDLADGIIVVSAILLDLN